MGLFDFLKKKETDSLGNPIDNDEIINDDFEANFEEKVQNANPSNASFKITVDDVFTITGRGTVVTGRIEIGTLALGDKVIIIRSEGEKLQTVVTGVEKTQNVGTSIKINRKLLSIATVGDNVGILLRGINRNMISRGDVIIKP